MKTILSIFKGGAMAMVMLLGMSHAAGPQFKVAGKITDENGSAVIGATIVVKNTQRGSTSDTNGNYSILAAKGEILVFSFLGYESQEKTVEGDKIDVKLVPSRMELEECVVVGYGTVKRMDFVGSVAALQSEPARVRGRNKQASRAGAYYDYSAGTYPGSEEYNGIKENRFISVKKDPLSTFGLEVDGASYANVRRLLNRGQWPEADAVRVEEFVNYFSYGYQAPQGTDAIKVNYEVGPCPWNDEHRLVQIGIKARELSGKDMPASNFVFLIDVSGSMYGPTRLELVKSSLKLLVNNLRDEDRVAIVVYSGAAGEVLPSTPGSDKQKIREALDNLTAGGSTAGGAGIQLAYKVARNNFIKDGNNRIILCTDGDFNVGVSSVDGLESLIEQQRKSGVFLTVLGYGMGNYKDNRMQTLAEKGNGNHAYIDNLQEANRVLVNEFGGTMYTVAKDAKLQVEFNPAHVKSFRLVGYESRLLEHEDFNDDTKDAGEIGAGHTVTAIYEIVPTSSRSNAGSIDPLKYQPNEISRRSKDNNELMTVKVRYKAPDGDVSRKIEVPVLDNRRGEPSEDFMFASAAAMFAQLLRDSDFKGTASYEDVVKTARKGLGEDTHGYRRELIRLAETAKGMAPAETVAKR